MLINRSVPFHVDNFIPRRHLVRQKNIWCRLNQLSASMKSSLKRLRLWDNRSHVNRPVDRNLQQAFNELHKMKEKLSLSDAIFEKAAYIYRKSL